MGPDEKRRSLNFSSRAYALVYRGSRLRRSRAWVSRAVTLQETVRHLPCPLLHSHKPTPGHRREQLQSTLDVVYKHFSRRCKFAIGIELRNAAQHITTALLAYVQAPSNVTSHASPKQTALSQTSSLLVHVTSSKLGIH